MNLLAELVIVLILIHQFRSSYDEELPNRNEKSLDGKNKKEIPYSISFRTSGQLQNQFKNDTFINNQDFLSRLYSLFSNYSSIEFKIEDFKPLFDSKLLNENQAILIWECLLNIKTERNLEMIDKNSILVESLNINTFLYNNTNMNPYIYSEHNNTEYNNIINEKKYQQYLNILFRSTDLKTRSVKIYLQLIFRFLFAKYLFKYPKLNLIFLTIVLIMNLLDSFWFYQIKYYITSSIFLCCFISNIYYIYLNIVIISGEKEDNFSIFYVSHFVTKEYFYMKLFISFFLLVVISYLTIASLRFHLNYIILFFLLEKVRNLLTNYYRLAANEYLQPMNCLIKIIFGLIILSISSVYYYQNVSISYELNSFLFINYIISFCYLLSLDKYAFIQKNDLAILFLECEMTNDGKDKKKQFNKKKNEIMLSTKYRTESVSDISIIIYILYINFLIFAIMTSSYFYFIISILFIRTINRNLLIFIDIKMARIISGLLFIVSLFILNNIKGISMSFVNEIVAINDEEFVFKINKYIKLLLYALDGFYYFCNRDFLDYFNLYNYTTYKYIFWEMDDPPSSENYETLKNAFNVKLILKEIFDFTPEGSINILKELTENSNDNSSNLIEQIFSSYIDEDCSNKNVIKLLGDYLINYLTLYILDDIFMNYTSKDYKFIYIVLRLCIYAKFALIFCEYSKTDLMKYLLIFMNSVFIKRYYNFPGLGIFDNFMLYIFMIGNYFIYFFVLNGNYLLNLFYFVYFLNNFHLKIDSFFGLPFSIGFGISKLIINIFKIERLKKLIYIIFNLGAIICLAFISYDKLTLINIKVKMFLIGMFKFDIVEKLNSFVISKDCREDYIEVKIINIINKVVRALENKNYSMQ